MSSFPLGPGFADQYQGWNHSGSRYSGSARANIQLQLMNLVHGFNVARNSRSSYTNLAVQT